MIQKGIIETLISPYEYKVRIPRYDKLRTTPGGVLSKDLSSAIVCSVPGTNISFSEGDVVLVGFENDELNKPVILGLLYREDIKDTNKFNIPYIKQILSDLENEINNININNLYTHVKYSNDNGITFTSLYEYKDTKIISTGQANYISADGIKIDPLSEIIYWSIIDSNNVDVTSNFNIITTLSATLNSDTNKEYTISESFSDSLIRIPIRFKGLKDLEISFNILEVSDFNNYHIVLTTDKNTLGSIYGNYMGICISTNPIAPLELSSYSWTSFYNSAYSLVDKLKESLLPRIERNEKTLYGFTYSDSLEETDNTGLLDGIKVSDKVIDIHGNDNKNIKFNSNNSMYIDNNGDSFILKDLEHTNPSSTTVFSEFYTNDDHLTLVLRKRSY